MSDPFAYVLYIPPPGGAPEILQLTGYSGRDNLYMAHTRRLEAKALVVLTKAQAKQLQYLSGPARVVQARLFGMQRHAMDIPRPAYTGQMPTWKDVIRPPQQARRASVVPPFHTLKDMHGGLADLDNKDIMNEASSV